MAAMTGHLALLADHFPYTGEFALTCNMPCSCKNPTKWRCWPHLWPRWQYSTF